MSGLAGIFKFDPRDPVSRSELLELARGMTRIGPDGGKEHVTRNLGMAYRAFHTTSESHLEDQPLVRDGCVLTWDGRLDNREEIRKRISVATDEALTDAELVLAAFRKWGDTCLADLIGDWALALWDTAKRELILARDYIGVRRLFYRLDESGITWCTLLEPLVLTSARKLHLDSDYLAGCLYPRPPLEATPYVEIRSAIPGSILTFQDGGKQVTRRYWSLNPHARIRYSTDSEYEEHFRELLYVAVDRRLRADRAILAELSGGLDSSSIVCVADDIRSRRAGYAIETLSYYDTDEPSGDERSYFALIEQKRGHVGHHISISAFTRETVSEALAPLPNDCFVASPGYFARSLRWESAIGEIQDQAGARVILSGLGGDEMLGGVQYEAPELADHLVSCRPISFLRSILQWSLQRRKTIYSLLADVFRLIRVPYHPESAVRVQGAPLPWAHIRPETLHSALPHFALWRRLTPSKICMELARYGLAQQLSFTDPPLRKCFEKRYPFLDRTLFEFLASIPRTQILQAGRRRHLMRRALHSIVPQQILNRTTKSFGFRTSATIFIDQQDAVDTVFEEAWLSDGSVVDAALLREHVKALQHGAPGNGSALRAAMGIEHWLRAECRRGILDLTSAGINRSPVFDHVVPKT